MRFAASQSLLLLQLGYENKRARTRQLRLKSIKINVFMRDVKHVRCVKAHVRYDLRTETETVRSENRLRPVKMHVTNSLIIAATASPYVV
jgi:hypothetical protein